MAMAMRKNFQVKRNGKIIDLRKIPNAPTANGVATIAPRASSVKPSFNNDGTFSGRLDNPNWWTHESAYLGDPSTDDSAGTNAPAPNLAPSWLDSALKAVNQILPAVVQVKQAQAVTNINKQRLAMGLPAISADQAGSNVQIGVSPAVKTAMYVGLGLAGVLALSMIMKKR